MGIYQNLNRRAKGISAVAYSWMGTDTESVGTRSPDDSGPRYVLQAMSPVAREGCQGLIYEGSKTNGSAILEIKRP